MQKSWGPMVFAAALAALALTGQSCLFRRPEVTPAPMSGTREELEADLPSIVPDEALENADVNFYFKHTKPGEYSDIFADITSVPGANVTANWSGPCLTDKSASSGTTDSSGKLKLSKRITCFGKYGVKGEVTKGDNKIPFDKKIDVL